jgi:threonine/homoserine/homoserine lactone efflux protein
MLASILGFITAATLLIIVPGPDSTLVLRNAVRYGRRPGAATALGTLTGLSVWVIAATVGLAALIGANPIGYAALRYIGGAYLIWLGARGLLAKKSHKTDTDDISQQYLQPSMWRSYLIGVTTNVFNPKIGAFFVAFLPAFIPAGARIGQTSMLLGTAFVLETAVWLFLILFVAKKLFDWLRRSTVKQRFEQLTGIILVGFGVRLIL